MNKPLTHKLSVISTATLLSALCLTNAHAILIDRGNGMIYDSDQDITWLQDANYAQTSGYHANGRMNWNDSIAWADSLTVGGFTDWRLFNAAPSDTNCSSSFTPSGFDTQNYGFNCTANELGHLFYNDFGLVAGDSVNSSTTSAYDLFDNIQSSTYWSGTQYVPFPDGAWDFSTSNGSQINVHNSAESYAWAVRSGDVAAPQSVPEPSSLALLVLGLLGFAGYRKQRL